MNRIEKFGIKSIGTYLPQTRRSNIEHNKKFFQLPEDFILQKIGVESIAVSGTVENVVSMCMGAMKDLVQNNSIDLSGVDAIILVTQNPETTIPHNSAMLHEALGLGPKVACFDVSQGCAGYIYGLSIVTSFLESNNFNNALLFTCDPYTKIVNASDQNTSLIFGDGASVSWISKDAVYYPKSFHFGIMPNSTNKLTMKDGHLFMDGRAIFNFVLKFVVPDMRNCLLQDNQTVDSIDSFLFHQGSKYILDHIAKLLEIPTEKIVYEMKQYGNLVSSSIPFLLKNFFLNQKNTLFLSGFGVGLSWGSVILEHKR